MFSLSLVTWCCSNWCFPSVWSPDVALTDVFPQSGHIHPDVALTDVFPQSGLRPVWSPLFWSCHIPLSPWCWCFVVCSRWGRRSREWRGTGGGRRRRRNRQGTGGGAAERWKVSQLCRGLEHFCPRKKSVSLYSHSYGHPRYFYRNVPHIPYRGVWCWSYCVDISTEPFPTSLLGYWFYCAGISTEMFPTSLLWYWFYCFAVQTFLPTETFPTSLLWCWFCCADISTNKCSPHPYCGTGFAVQTFLQTNIPYNSNCCAGFAVQTFLQTAALPRSPCEVRSGADLAAWPSAAGHGQQNQTENWNRIVIITGLCYDVQFIYMYILIIVTQKFAWAVFEKN